MSVPNALVAKPYPVFGPFPGTVGMAPQTGLYCEGVRSSTTLPHSLSPIFHNRRQLSGVRFFPGRLRQSHGNWAFYALEMLKQ